MYNFYFCLKTCSQIAPFSHPFKPFLLLNSLFIFVNSLFIFTNSLFIFTNSLFIFINGLFIFANSLFRKNPSMGIFLSHITPAAESITLRLFCVNNFFFIFLPKKLVV